MIKVSLIMLLIIAREIICFFETTKALLMKGNSWPLQLHGRLVTCNKFHGVNIKIMSV